MNRLMITAAALCAVATTGACSGDQPGDDNQTAANVNVASEDAVGSVPVEQTDVNASVAEVPALNTSEAATPVAEPKKAVERQPAPARTARTGEAPASKAKAEEEPRVTAKEEPKAAAPTSTCAPEHRALGHC